MPAGGTERGVQCPSPLAKRRRRAELSCELARRQERLLEAEHRLLERPPGEARILGKLEQRPPPCAQERLQLQQQLMPRLIGREVQLPYHQWRHLCHQPTAVSEGLLGEQRSQAKDEELL